MILSIETSTEVCSVALHTEGKLLAYYELFTEKSHSSSLTLLIDNILKQAKASMAQLTGIVLSEGPGSYTGLRVGTSVAKGLCYALDIPLYAVSTLLAMAHTASQSILEGDYLLCPMIDARRMEVYTLLAKRGIAQQGVAQYHLNIIRPTEAFVFDDAAMKTWDSEDRPIVVFGNGAKKIKQASSHEKLFLLDNIYPSAKAIGDLFFLQNPPPVHVAYFEPYYLKQFNAK